MAPTTKEIAAIPTRTTCITPRTWLICSNIWVAVKTWKLVSSLFLSNSFSIFSCSKGMSETTFTWAIIASTFLGSLNISLASSNGMLIWLSSWEFPVSSTIPTILKSLFPISILSPILSSFENISFAAKLPTVATFFSPSWIFLPSCISIPESR